MSQVDKNDISNNSLVNYNNRKKLTNEFSCEASSFLNNEINSHTDESFCNSDTNNIFYTNTADKLEYLNKIDLEQYVIDTFKKDLAEVQDSFDDQNQKDGFITNTYNFFKEATGTSISKEDLQNAIIKQNEAIQMLIKAKENDNFKVVYAQITNTEFNEEKLLECYFAETQLENLNSNFNQILSTNESNENKEKNINKAILEIENQSGISYEELVTNYKELSSKYLGPTNELVNTLNNYIDSQDIAIDKFAQTTQIAGLGLTVAGSILCFIPIPGVAQAIGISTMNAGRLLSLAGTFGDNILEAIEIGTNNVNNKDEYDIINNLVKETGIDVALFASGICAGKAGNIAKSYVLNCTNNTLISRGAEIATDASLSLASDYLLTGEVNFANEGRSQILSILTGLAYNKVATTKAKMPSNNEQTDSLNQDTTKSFGFFEKIKNYFSKKTPEDAVEKIDTTTENTQKMFPDAEDNINFAKDAKFSDESLDILKTFDKDQLEMAKMFCTAGFDENLVLKASQAGNIKFENLIKAKELKLDDECALIISRSCYTVEEVEKYARFIQEDNFEPDCALKAICLGLSDTQINIAKKAKSVGFTGKYAINAGKAEFNDEQFRIVQEIFNLGKEVPFKKIEDMAFECARSNFTAEQIKSLKERKLQGLSDVDSFEAAAYNYTNEQCEIMTLLSGTSANSYRHQAANCNLTKQEALRLIQLIDEKKFTPADAFMLISKKVSEEKIKALSSLYKYEDRTIQKKYLDLSDDEVASINELRAAGCTKRTITQLIDSKLSTIQKETIIEILKAGFDDQIAMKGKDCTKEQIEFLKELKEIGYSDIIISKAISEGINSQNMDIIRDIQDKKPSEFLVIKILKEKYNADQINKILYYRDAGVSEKMALKLIKLQIKDSDIDLIKKCEKLNLDEKFVIRCLEKENIDILQKHIIATEHGITSDECRQIAIDNNFNKTQLEKVQLYLKEGRSETEAVLFVKNNYNEMQIKLYDETISYGFNDEASQESVKLNLTKEELKKARTAKDAKIDDVMAIYFAKNLSDKELSGTISDIQKFIGEANPNTKVKTKILQNDAGANLIITTEHKVFKNTESPEIITETVTFDEHGNIKTSTTTKSMGIIRTKYINSNNEFILKMNGDDVVEQIEILYDDTGEISHVLHTKLAGDILPGAFITTKYDGSNYPEDFDIVKSLLDETIEIDLEANNYKKGVVVSYVMKDDFIEYAENHKKNGCEINRKYQYNPENGDSSYAYQIKDKQGELILNLNRSFNQNADGTTTTTINGAQYTAIFKSDYVIAIKKPNGEIVTLDLKTKFSPNEIDNMTDFYDFCKTVPADDLITLSENIKKIVLLPDSNKAAMDINMTLYTNTSVATMAHELGHSIDFCDIIPGNISGTISSNAELIEIYNKEFEIFKEEFPQPAQEVVSYFSQTGGGKSDTGLAELVAEVNMLLKTYGANDNQLTARAEYLVRYFPETVATIAKLLGY